MGDNGSRGRRSGERKKIRIGGVWDLTIKMFWMNLLRYEEKM